MIQQANLKLKCQVDEHKEEIDFVCYDQFCTGFRLQCFECFKKGIHNNHINDVKKINTLMQFLENNNKDCDNLIDDLNKYIENVNQSFSQLKRGITNKYSLLKERLVNLDSCQINDYLNSTIQLNEYKQSISKIIEEQTKNISHSFNNLYQQLQLSSFNYYQLDENDIKLSEDLYKQGYQLYLDKKYNEAIEQLDKSIQINPNNQVSISCKGQCLRLLNKFEDAITWLDKALAIDPKHVVSLSDKGQCLRLLNKFEDAITWLDKALAIDPKHVSSLCIKGDCLRFLKQYDKSLTFLNQALSINPNHTFSLDRIGNCLQDQEKYQQALIYYERKLKIQPNDQWTKNQKEFCEKKLKN
ncbi:unnamed protein product [Paramecium pentaurelia]|uniref:Tetratricopeptide repeat protein n=1 Tax=Paramecium pentaurelia TaxID=43138 RepID=A0A8S1YG24_9CILI|nr:unnamed protein product [Paramecium pentaurelia]